MPPRKDVSPRAWQRMLSGRRLDLLDPSPLDIELSDIAHGLARVARWNGQTLGAHAFSVAQHSLLVEDIFGLIGEEPNPKERIAALLHDAAEYVIGDMISPFKAVVGGGYREVEHRLRHAIHLRFGLKPDLSRKLEADALVKVDEVLVSSSNVDFAVAALFDSDEIFLRIVSMTPPVSISLAYRMRMITEVPLH